MEVTKMGFTGKCPVCGTNYTMLDREASHSGHFEVIVDDDDLEAEKGDTVDQVCETCHTAGFVRRIVDRS